MFGDIDETCARAIGVTAVVIGVTVVLTIFGLGWWARGLYERIP